ncbi:hypothetical protein ACIP2Y_03610 [Streptomyces sviceus]|uniref:hypothetical protein n=1 Tax=Streptomyces sviceus TaxID=285530 RepID=UPI003829C913
MKRRHASGLVALVPALATDPEPVLDAFRERLRRPGAGALPALADGTTAALARRVAVLVREAVERRPGTWLRVPHPPQQIPQ